jgi:hypothetical protein
MNQKTNYPLEGVIDKVEDAVKHAFGSGSRERSRERHHHGHHQQHHNRCHEDERTTINVTVNVSNECCPFSGGGAATGTGGTPPGRPVHQTGTSDGSGASGLGVVGGGGIIKIPSRPGNVWPGPRTKLYLPFLFIRATAGDTAARPIAGTFWESPDILILPGVAPSAAPPLPPDLGGVAKSGADNTIYAHVWNLGQAPAHGALVEFYWFNPSLGFSGKDANLIGKTYVDLGPRSGAESHKLVKCPSSWIAMYENGGHECIVVRISQPVTDPLSGPAWDASQNRHIGQRNIHVMTAAEAAAKPTIGINIGPLYNQPAQVAVARADTGTMPWLHLVTNSRTKTLATASASGDVGITPPIPSGAGLPNLGAIPNPRGVGLIGDSHGVTGDGQQVGFVATDGDPGSGNAHVYRVSGSQNGGTFGGYTVVVLGS